MSFEVASPAPQAVKLGVDMASIDKNGTIRFHPESIAKIGLTPGDRVTVLVDKGPVPRVAIRKPRGNEPRFCLTKHSRLSIRSILAPLVSLNKSRRYALQVLDDLLIVILHKE